MTKNKTDKNKPIAGAMYADFPHAVTSVIEVATQGMNKYSRSGWLDTPDGIVRYTDAMHRHLLAEQRGEIYDKESRLRHATHAAWNAMARLELILREKEINSEKLSEVFAEFNAL